jgi:hypothetical protein
VCFAVAGATLTGGKLPRPGATVTYTVEIVNGQKTLAANTTQLAVFDVTVVTAVNRECKDAANNTVAVGGAVIQVALAAGSKITCTFGVVVTAVHASNGEIPAFTVAAALSAVTTDISLTMESLTVVAVPVSTGSTLAVSAAAPRSGTFLQGEALTYSMGCIHVLYTCLQQQRAARLQHM